MKKLLCIILFLLLLTANVGQSQSLKMFGQQLSLGHRSTKGLVFYWRGIQAGEVVDESFYRNHGTITGAMWVGEGLIFNGSSSKVVTTNVIPIGQVYTFVWRHRVDSTVNVRHMFGMHFSYGQFYMPDGSSTLRLYDGSNLNGTIADTVGEWVTHAFVGTPSSRTFYRNGLYHVGDGAATYDYTYSNTLELGHRHNSISWWNGGISNFMIYDRALSATKDSAFKYINTPSRCRWRIKQPNRFPLHGQVGVGVKFCYFAGGEDIYYFDTSNC